MTRHKPFSPRLLLLALGLAVLPACSSSAGGLRGDGRGPGARLADRVADRLAYRPVYPLPNPVPRTRPLFLSGYAGARYGPDQAAPVYPTTYQVVPSPWLQWLRSR